MKAWLLPEAGEVRAAFAEGLEHRRVRWQVESTRDGRILAASEWLELTHYNALRIAATVRQLNHERRTERPDHAEEYARALP